MRRTAALIASVAMLAPAAATAAPAEAATTGDRIKLCTKQKHGTKVRIQLRTNGEFTRVRFSHPRGKGTFYAPKVKRVDGAVDGDSGTANTIQFRQNLASSYRLPPAGNGTTVQALLKFKLRNGKSIGLNCSMR